MSTASAKQVAALEKARTARAEALAAAARRTLYKGLVIGFTVGMIAGRFL